MARCAYVASKAKFIDDFQHNRFMREMCQGALNNRIGGGKSEKKSWKENAEKIFILLQMAQVPDDVFVAFEYKSPHAGRIDCMLFGKDAQENCNIIHIEMKQWWNSSVHQAYGTGVFQVTANVAGTKYELRAHPSQQALGYQRNILNFIQTVHAPGHGLQGYAYCYNYFYGEIPKDLYDARYEPILKVCPLHGGDQVDGFATTLKGLLAYGAGSDVFKEFDSCPIRQTKKLVEAASGIFTGTNEFNLLDEQITSANTIFGMVDEAVKNPSKKLALVVKGGPGTGKTVIALRVIAELASKYGELTSFFTTRSSALRETLKHKLNKIAAGKLTSAADLIQNIYSFKPCHYKEGEVDVLLVDEAHRISRSANYMADKKNAQTYLPQILSLLYCSKVSVFFIDDHQGVSADEIGTAEYIKNAAENYAKLLDEEKGKFENNLLKVDTSLKKARKELDMLLSRAGELDKSEFELKLGKLQKRIEKKEYEAYKAYQLEDVRSSVKDIAVCEIELKTQFRCNGSDNYLDWLDQIIYKRKDEVAVRFGSEYECEICDSPADLERKIRSLDLPNDNPGQVARIAAGWCWDWSEYPMANGDLRKDVVIGDWAMPWETNKKQAYGEFASMYAPSKELWATHPKGVNQVGCIYTAQGFEVDYIGVIMARDITYDPVRRRIVAVKGYTHSVNDNDRNFDELIKNIYRVLLSRGKCGCFIYCENDSLQQYLKGMLVRAHLVRDSEETIAEGGIVEVDWKNRIFETVDEGLKYVNWLPLYSMKAACGKFGAQEVVEPEGWVEVAGLHGRRPKYFVVRACGHSMEPKIHDGQLCVFEYRDGTCDDGDIILAQHCDIQDDETHGAFTIKKFKSEKRGDEFGGISLLPLNPSYVPISICNEGEYVRDFKVVGVYKENVECLS